MAASVSALLSTNRAGGHFVVDLTGQQHCDLLAESHELVLTRTVNKLTPDGPFNGSFMDDFQFIFFL